MDRQDRDTGQTPDQRNMEIPPDNQRYGITDLNRTTEVPVGRERDMRGSMQREEQPKGSSMGSVLLAAGVGWLVWRTLRGRARASRHHEEHETRHRQHRGRRMQGRSSRQRGGRSYREEARGRDDRGARARNRPGRSNYDYRYGSMNAGDLAYGGLGTSARDYGGEMGFTPVEYDTYDYGDTYDYDTYGPTTVMAGPVDTDWSYAELWWIPGPYTGQGPQGYQRSDEQIREDAHERLTQHGGVDAGDITVHVDNGVVTLEGNVDSRREKRMAEDAVDDIFGVTDVRNHLRVRRQT
ncbi:MAG TPA: BON domain-containing protein [Trueperaceae bacterium]